jgi:MFS transporter (putative signal transducer)
MLMVPFLIDCGFGLETLGLLTGLGGTTASLLGTLAAARLIGRFGAERLLWAVAAAQAALFLGLAVATRMPGLPLEALGGLALALSFATGAGFVALYTAMMGWAAGPQPGIDFTLLQCADALVAAVAGLAAGSLAQHVGYAPCFLLAAALALTAAVGLARRDRIRAAA